MEIQRTMRAAVLAGLAWGVVLLAAAADLRADGPDTALVAGTAGAGAPPQLVLDVQGFLDAPYGLSFSPDGNSLAAAGEKVVRIWNLQTGELTATLRGDREESSFGDCSDVVYSPNGHELLVGVDDHGSHGAIRVYDPADSSEIKELANAQGMAIRHLAFSRDGHYLASAADNGKILLWDWPARRIVGEIKPPRPDQPINDVVAFPSDAPVLFVLGASGPTLFRVPSGEQLNPGDPLPAELLQWMQRLNEFAYPDGGVPAIVDLRLEARQWVAAGTSDKGGRPHYWASVWNSTAPGPAKVYDEHKWKITAVALAPDGRRAATADQFGEVHVWDPSSGKQLQLFKAKGQSLYDAAFDESGTRIAFGTSHYSGSEWRENHFGPADSVFDLATRAISRGREIKRQNEVTELGGNRLHLDFVRNNFYLDCDFPGGRTTEYRLSAGRQPTRYTFLRSARLGVEEPVVWADAGGAMALINPRNSDDRRYFIGHDSFISGVGQSPGDGRLLITSSTDRTIRLWSLDDYRPTGEFDFKYQDDSVIKVDKTSSVYGKVRPGDRIVSMDGKNLTELRNEHAHGAYRYAPGGRVPLKMSRDGRTFDVEMVLKEGPDRVLPLLNCFITQDDEWILWTPQGYYDASPGADRFIGWHVNRGPRHSAAFYRVEQFKKQLYRPDIIDRIIQSGNSTVAIREANEQRRRGEQELDFRKPEQLGQYVPPKVVLREPRDGTRVQTGKLKVSGIVESRTSRPVRDVKVLLNGNPVNSIKDAAGPGGAFATDVELQPGRNTIAVIASDGATTTAPQEVSVVYDLKQASEQPLNRPNLYVLAIGISHYAKAGSGFDNLEYAHLDAKDFVDTISRQHDGKLYNKVESKLLVEDRATAQGIREGMEWLVRSVTQGDVAMVFISAHGFLDNAQHYYLATHESDLNQLRSTSIGWDEICRWLENDFPPCKRVMFLDTCHSGGVTGLKGAFDPLHDLVRPEVGVLVFASSTAREESLEDHERKHGAFTAALLEALTTVDTYPPPKGDGIWYWDELGAALKDRVKQLTAGKQHPIMPPVSLEKGLNLQFALLQVTR